MNLYARARNDQNTKHQEKGKHGLNRFNTRDEYYCYCYYYYWGQMVATKVTDIPFKVAFLGNLKKKRT